MSGIDEAFEDHAAVVGETRRALGAPLAELIDVLASRLREGKKLMVCGNGGSAASAQHFVAELVGRYTETRSPLRAAALTSDPVTMSALANDEGFDTVFSRQVEAMADEGDVVVALSCSGASSNVVAAAHAARRRGCLVVAMVGAAGGPLADHADLTLVVPSDSVARIQEMHDLCLHILADGLERSMGDDPEDRSPRNDP